MVDLAVVQMMGHLHHGRHGHNSVQWVIHVITLYVVLYKAPSCPHAIYPGALP